MLIQFGLAGLGSLIVICYRKEKLKEYGLTKNNFFKTIILSMVVCIPSMIFLLANNEIDSYLPLKGCFFTKTFLNSSFPTNVLGYILIALVWGVAEGFWNSSYVTSYSDDLESEDSVGKNVEYRANMYNPMYYLSNY